MWYIWNTTKNYIFQFFENSWVHWEIAKIYPNDLDNTFLSECFHLQSYLLNSDIDIDIDNLTPITLYHYLREKPLHIEIFPNIDTPLGVFVNVPVSNCTTEWSFTCLKCLINYLRFTQTDEKLNNLALFSIGNGMLSELNAKIELTYLQWRMYTNIFLFLIFVFLFFNSNYYVFVLKI